MAVFPVAAGHPDYSSTGTSKFIPQIWSTKLVVKFYKTTVFGEISNTDYEGEISDMGDKVIIRTTPDITINDYRKGQNLDYESPESANIELLIDKGKSFSYRADDIDKHQADIAYVDKWADDASQQMAITVDSDVINNVYTDANASNIGTTAGAVSSSYNIGTTGSAVAVTKNNVIDSIVDCASVLTEQNVPMVDRWFVIPTWMANYIKKSDLKDASMTGDTVSPLRNGRLGIIDQFTIYVSNNYTAVSDGGNDCYNVLFGHPTAITFAAQMTKMETLRNPNTFGDLVRGLNVYGYKVIKGESLGVLYCRKA